MNVSVLQEAHGLSHKGQITFPEVIGRLLKEKVERYAVDFVRGETTYYGEDGSSHRIASVAHASEVAPAFSASGVQGAVKAAQRDEIRFPEFVKRVLVAGCMGYIVFLSGKRVMYIGRLGDTHIELFPK